MWNGHTLNQRYPRLANFSFFLSLTLFCSFFPLYLSNCCRDRCCFLFLLCFVWFCNAFVLIAIVIIVMIGMCALTFHFDFHYSWRSFFTHLFGILLCVCVWCARARCFIFIVVSKNHSYSQRRVNVWTLIIRQIQHKFERKMANIFPFSFKYRYVKSLFFVPHRKGKWNNNSNSNSIRKQTNTNT